MKIFKKVAIVGMGLIGGSLALAIKEKRLASCVVGVSRHKKSLNLARRIKAIDEGSQFLDILKGADLVVLATPVHTIVKLAPAISRFVGKECVIIDVGSTKEEIVNVFDKKFPAYIGCHPLAGSEKRSILNANKDIFKKSLCIITPFKNTDKRALEKIVLLWKSIGVRISFLSPAEHDRIISFISHMPHVAAFVLMHMIPRDYLKFAASGLKDTTRIASSDSGLWSDILLSNRKNIINTIEIAQKELKKMKSFIRAKDRERLAIFLEKAKEKRDTLG